MVLQSSTLLWLLVGVTVVNLAGMITYIAPTVTVYQRSVNDTNRMQGTKVHLGDLVGKVDKAVAENVTLFAAALNVSRDEILTNFTRIIAEDANSTACDLIGNTTTVSLMLDVLNTSVADTNARQDTVNDDLVAMLARLKTLQTNITTTRTLVNTFSTNVTTLQTIVSGIDTNITRINTLINQINYLRNISTFDNYITSANSKNFIMQGDVTVLNSKLLTIESYALTIEQQLQNLTDKFNLTGVAEQLNTLDTMILSLAGGGELLTSSSTTISTSVLTTVIDNSNYSPILTLTLPDPPKFYVRKYIRLLYIPGQNVTIKTSNGALKLDAVNRFETELEFIPRVGWIILDKENPNFYPYKQSGTATNPTVSSGGLGDSVALSCDGTILVSGAPHFSGDLGCVVVFNRTSWNESFTQPGVILNGTGAAPFAGFVFMGFSVDISCDGKTVVFGGYFDNTQSGALWVFHDYGGGNWIQMGSKLHVTTDHSARENLGYSVAISGDGKTIVGGAPNEGIAGWPQGAVWVFKLDTPSQTWSQFQKIFTNDTALHNTGQSGFDVDINYDGSVIVFGAQTWGQDTVGTPCSTGPGCSNQTGATFVYTLPANMTAYSRSAILVGPGAANGDHRGRSVSISADGNVIAYGIPGSGSTVPGAVGIFNRTNGEAAGWGDIGSSIAIQPTGVISNGAQFGDVVRLSADGGTLVVGAPLDNSGTGSVWVYQRTVDAAGVIKYVEMVNRFIPSTASSCGQALAISDNGGLVAVGCAGVVDIMI